MAKATLEQWVHSNCAGLLDEIANIAKEYGNSEEDSESIARITMILVRQEFEARLKNRPLKSLDKKDKE